MAISAGTGSELRRPLGIAIIGGLIVSQMLTLYTTPALYLFMDRLRSRAARFIPLLAGASLAAGCSVGPRYVTPDVPAPAAYKEADASVLRTADPADRLPRGPWWEQFGDARLDDLEKKLNENNASLAEAEARFRQARALVRQDRAAYFPVATGSTSIGRTRPGTGSRTVAPSAAPFTDYSASGAISWEADVWGRVRHSVAAGVAAAQAAAADVENARLSLGAELAVDYFELRSLDAEVALFDQTIEAYERAATLTRNQYDVGIVSRADVEQAATQLEAARAQSIDLRLQRDQVEHAVAVLLGEPPAALSLTPMSLDGEPPEIPPDLPARLLERRPDVAAAERRVAAANAEVGVAQAAFFPAITLAATGGVQATQLQQWLSWPARFWSVGPALAATLFDGGARRAAKAAAIAAYDETVATYRQTVLTAFQDVEDNLAAQRLIRDEADRQRAAAAAAQRSLDISLNQYRAGLVSYLQVATQQTALLTNQRAVVSLAARRYTAAVQLVRALGGGWQPTRRSNF